MKKILVSCILLFMGVVLAHPKNLSFVEDSLDGTDDELSITSIKEEVVNDKLDVVDDYISVKDNEKSVFDQKLNVVEENEIEVGSFGNVVKSTIDNVVQVSVQDVAIDVTEDPFVGGYGKFLKVVTQRNPQAKRKFVQYFTDWQWANSREDFFDYAGSRAEREKRVEFCYDAALKKFGIGSAIIATTWVVAFVVPGGTVVYSTILVIAKATTWSAVSGAVFDGVVSATKSIYSGHSTDEIIYEMLDGAVEGYLFGAEVGLAAGLAHVTIMSQMAKKVKDMYVIFGEQVYDKSGKVLVDLSGVGKKSIKTASELLEKEGDDALYALIKVAEKNPKRLSTAIQYINAKGVNGIYDVLAWNGVIPEWVTKSVIETAEKIAKSQLKLSMDALRKLPGIKLTTEQLDNIRQKPNYLKELVKESTGKEFKGGYLEFFIRLTKTNPNQAHEIWNYSKAVRDVIKDAIRPGGTHEWLMCENFIDFLTDPKWRRDGPYLVKILSVLTQNTNDVYLILRDGTKWTHTLESQTTFGRAGNPKALIHNLIRNVIKNSNSTEDMLVNMDKMVKERYPKEVYEKFSKALEKCFI